MSNQASEDELEHELDDIVHDALVEVFCYDCEHPRCLNKVKLYKTAIQSLIRTEKLKLLDNLERKSTHYTPDGLVADGLDPWAVSVSTINATRNKLEAEL